MTSTATPRIPLFSLRTLLLLLLPRCPHALDNGLALTPPMGWLSWERFGCETDCQTYPDTCISEQLYKAQADRLASDGYAAAGYVYVSVDDCWGNKSHPRDTETGRLLADQERFPSGMKALGSYIHSLGLKYGLYGDIGTLTCGGYGGFRGSFEVDAQTLKDWEVDSIKVDGCYEEVSAMNVSYPAFGAALNATGRPILYVCSWPAYDPLHCEENDVIGRTLTKICNQWRNYGDISDSWASVRSIVDYWARTTPEDVMVRAAGPGHWNDPDMLLTGNPGLSLSEQQTQFSLWAIFAAPLMISADLRKMPEASKAILLNQEIIKVNQDPLGRQGWCASCNASEVHGAPNRVWVRPLAGQRWAVVLENTLDIFGPQKVTFRPDIHLQGMWHEGGRFLVRDLQAHQDIGVFESEYWALVDESSSLMILVTPAEPAFRKIGVEDDLSRVVVVA